jgi:acetyl esterase/lipase
MPSIPTRRGKPRSKRRFSLFMSSALAALGLAGCSPAGLLNGASRIVPGGDPARLAAGGVAFAADPRLKLDVWAPRRSPREPLPVVIFFYGGGWVSGSRGDYGFAARAFAGRDFIAVVPDYRLVPKVRFPSFVEDAALAVKWTRDNAARFGGDPRRITLAGHSAGAYLAALLALDRHYLADVGVDPAIVRAAALLSGPYDFFPFTEMRGRDALGAWPRPKETQPIHFARAGAPPMLLLHGTADRVVRPYNSRNLAAALTKAGSTATLKEYSGRSHTDIVKALSPLFRNSIPVLDDSAAFLREHSGAPTSHP